MALISRGAGSPIRVETTGRDGHPEDIVGAGLQGGLGGALGSPVLLSATASPPKTPSVVFRKFINIPFVVSLSNHERNTLKKLALRQAQGERPLSPYL